MPGLKSDKNMPLGQDFGTISKVTNISNNYKLNADMQVYSKYLQNHLVFKDFKKSAKPS
jgi:hypothetical protein